MNIFIRKNIGWWSVVLLAVLPILRWLFLEPLSFRFADLNAITTSFGQMAGLLGMILFVLNLIISARSKIIDKIFFGMPDAYKIHHEIGAISFCLLLFHPLFLVVKFFNFSIKQAAMFFVPQGADAVSWGIYALGLMILLMVATFYIKLKYHVWKLSHKFMLAVFVMAIAHVIFIESDISQDLFLRYYILGFSFFGLALSFYQAFLSKNINKNFEYNVSSSQKLAENVWQIKLQAQKKGFDFKPGQFVFIRFLGQGTNSESHPFSIASSPDKNNFEVIIKSLGDYTSELDKIKLNTKALVQGPYGKFSYLQFPDKDQIWLAGGIGITPFLSMARSLPRENKQKIDLYYCAKNQAESVLLDELQEIAKTKNNFRVISWCSDQKGFVTAGKVLELSYNIKDSEIFLCGPSAFMENLRKQFLAMNIKNKNIHWENFNFF